ncbi:tRNA dihydrouridine(20/20a) synthase DusA [Thioalkalivibrio sp.]|uniref:tRNA dihydrouridine(20/20a) synthase DusA n=1 Tax=Thioalkalivibrio sp. TaxID=2093813 RepID=UPI003562F444
MTETSPDLLPHRFSVAPMMDWTDRWCRRFHRLLTRQAMLYTEMVHANAVLHGDRRHLLGFDSQEHPVALQLGGSDPRVLAEAARIGAGFGYDEINLNVGCPSQRVQSGAFGACLMATPETVAQCVEAMADAVSIPVTVKHRIGIDEQDSEADLHRFVSRVAESGCSTFIVHARKAWLNGLSPEANREVPPLDYTRVYRLKEEFPSLRVLINGGIEGPEAGLPHLRRVDGVMLGRAAYYRPFELGRVDRLYFGAEDDRGHPDIVEDLVALAEELCSRDVPLSRLTRHVLGLFHGAPGARHWRRVLTEGARRRDAGPELIEWAVGPCLQAAG